MVEEYAFIRKDSRMKVYGSRGYIGCIRYDSYTRDYYFDPSFWTMFIKRKTMKTIFLKMQEFAENDPDVKVS